MAANGDSSRCVEAPDLAAQNCTWVCVHATVQLSHCWAQLCASATLLCPTEAQIDFQLESRALLLGNGKEKVCEEDNCGEQRSTARPWLPESRSSRDIKGPTKADIGLSKNYNLRHLFGEAQPGCSWKHTSAFQLDCLPHWRPANCNRTQKVLPNIVL